MSKRFKKSWRRYSIKALIGVILLINGYLSHWGPWRWPNNYYIIAVSVVIYHVGSYLYDYLSGVSNTEGNLVYFRLFRLEILSLEMMQLE
jgi:hypothetical protein